MQKNDYITKNEKKKFIELYINKIILLFIKFIHSNAYKEAINKLFLIIHYQNLLFKNTLKV